MISLDFDKFFYERTKGGREHMWFKWRGNSLSVLDQRKLPGCIEWCELTDAVDVASAIKNMVVRGAPAVGICAFFGVVLSSKKTDIRKNFQKIKDMLLKTRPTAINLKNALDRVEGIIKSEVPDKDLPEVLEERAIEFWKEDFISCLKIGMNLQSFINDGARIFTICNTGALATGGFGTAFAGIRYAKEIGKKIFVWIPETRPFMQGGRLTTFELEQNKIEYRLITDFASGIIFSKKLVDVVIVGADRITQNGYVANKVGTFILSLLSKKFKIPFIVAAPSTTIDRSTKRSIPIEERDGKEIIKINNKTILPQYIKTYNPVFDITPPHLISAICTENGIYTKPFKF